MNLNDYIGKIVQKKNETEKFRVFQIIRNEVYLIYHELDDDNVAVTIPVEEFLNDFIIVSE